MLTQKKNGTLKNCTKKHNPSEETTHDLEQTEKEHQILHEKTDESGGQSGFEKLLRHMRDDQNIALAAERWHDANVIQQAIILVLDATTGPEPEGMGTRVTNGICFMLTLSAVHPICVVEHSAM